MKRSEINQALKNMEEMIRKCGFHLPPFCDFTPDERKENGLLRVYYSKEDGSFVDSDVTIHSDGREYTVPAGTQIRLTPGESITVYPYMYHDFEVEKGSGAVLLGEVSMCNDDNTDNRFYEPMGRFPEIEEDEAPYRLLCNEYPPAP